MKLLLDENLPKKLKQDLTEYEVYTVAEKGWAGISNGKLLSLLVENNFNVLITFDKNLQFQQNFKKYTVTVLILSASNNSYLVLKNLVDKIKSTLASPLTTGPIEIME